MENASKNKTTSNEAKTLQESIQLSEKKVRPYGEKYPGGVKTKPMLAAFKYGDDKVSFGTNFAFDSSKKFIPLVKTTPSKFNLKGTPKQLKEIQNKKENKSEMPMKNEDLTNKLLCVRENLFQKHYPGLVAQINKKANNTQAASNQSREVLRSKPKAKQQARAKEGKRFNFENEVNIPEQQSEKGFVTQRYEILLAH